MNLTLTAAPGSAPAGVQWTFTYDAARVSAISASAGASTVAAGKAITCAAGTGTYTCLVTGVNSNVLQNGTLANVNVTLSPSATGLISIGVTNPSGASLAGSALTTTGTAATITTVANCTYSLPVASAGVGSGGGTGMAIALSTQSGCPWNAASNAPWIHVTAGATGSGPGTVGVNVDANTGALALTGTLTIGGLTYTIVQQPPVGTNNEAFIRQLYLDILNRTADIAGLNTWLGWLNAGQMTRAQVASQFFQSPEFSVTGSYISRLYLALLMRDPDYSGWTGWFSYLRAGHSQTEILNQFIGSVEFQSRYGSLDNTGFVTLLYNNVLGRPPDSAGLSQWVAWLNAGTLTRADVTNGFVTSAEFVSKTQNRVYAIMLYIGFLRRAGETAGLDGWTNWLTNGTYTLEQVVNGFITSPEYLARFTASTVSFSSSQPAIVSTSLKDTSQSDGITLTQPAGTAPKSAPSITSLMPFAGSGAGTALSVVFSDPKGWDNISDAQVLINSNLFPEGGCYISYRPATGTFQLLNDSGTAWSGTVLSNSQCSLSGASASGTGNNLTLTLPVTFQAGFGSGIGKKNIFLQVTNAQGLVAPWLLMGVWYPAGQVGAPTPWYRLYNPYSHIRHFTTDRNEYNNLGARGFTQEGSIGDIYGAPGTSGDVTAVPLWRIAVVGSQSHFWTADRDEYVSLIQDRAAYVGEGADGFVFPTQPAGGIPLMRLSVDSTAPWIQHWTTDQNEYAAMGRLGWSQEGIAAYLLPGPSAPAMSPAAAVTSAASYQVGPVTPGEELAVFGSGPVSFDGVEVEAVPASGQERRVVVPDVVSRHTILRIGDEQFDLPVGEASPAIFAADQFGHGSAGSAARGSVLTIYATGLGQAPVSATIGPYPATVISVDPVRGGTVAVKLRVPEQIEPAAAVPVRLQASQAFSQLGVTITVE